MHTDSASSITRTSEDDILLAHVLSLNLEKDKQLLTLSAAGIGLLGTFLAAKGVSNIAEIAISCGGLFCFLAAIWCLLNAFQLNKEFTDQTIRFEPDAPEVTRASRALYREQKRGATFFYAAAFLSAVFALVTASNSFEINQAEKSKQLLKTSTEIRDKKLNELTESVALVERTLSSIEEKLRKKTIAEAGQTSVPNRDAGTD